MTSRYTRLAYILMAVGFLIRIIYAFSVQPMYEGIFSDMRNYVMIADQIARGEWYATHFFQPIGFPYLILILKQFTLNWFAWLSWIHITTSTLTLWFFWQVARNTLGDKIALITLGIGTIHFPWIVFVSLALAETLFIFFLSVLAWFTLKLVQKNKPVYAIGWSAAFLFAFLIKGTHVFFGPIFLLGLLIYKKESIKNIALISVIVGAGLIGHGLFTQAKIGKFQLSASAGGLNFLEGKCPIKNNADNNGYSWLSPLYFQLDMHQLKRWDHHFTESGFFMQEGMKCVIKNPLVLLQSFEGIPFLFMGNTLWPANQFKTSGLMRIYELFFACFSIIGLVVFIRFLNNSPNKIDEILILVLPILAIFICVYIFKSEIRFRIPFDIWIIPLAVKGWLELKAAKLISPQPL